MRTLENSPADFRIMQSLELPFRNSMVLMFAFSLACARIWPSVRNAKHQENVYVHFFYPKYFRTLVYHKALYRCLDYAKKLGYAYLGHSSTWWFRLFIQLPPSGTKNT